jgi:hypothetical protein
MNARAYLGTRMIGAPFLALALGIAVMSLTACGGGAKQTGIDLSQDAAAALTRNISDADLKILKDVCTAASPSLLVAAADKAPAPVKAVAVYPEAFCTDVLSPAKPVTANANSVAWLTKTLTYVQDAAKIASYVLPIALSLL